jgi:hypothetical protein
MLKKFALMLSVSALSLCSFALTPSQAGEVLKAQSDLTNNPIPNTPYWLVVPESSKAKAIVDTINAEKALFEPVLVQADGQMFLILDGGQTESQLREEIPRAKGEGLLPQIVQSSKDAYKAFSIKACPVEHQTPQSLISQALYQLQNLYPQTQRVKAIENLLQKALMLAGETPQGEGISSEISSSSGGGNTLW